LFRDRDGVYGELKPDDGKPEKDHAFQTILLMTPKYDFIGKTSQTIIHYT
jgi:hypothetical protein